MVIANENTLKKLTASVMVLNQAVQSFNDAYASFLGSLGDVEWIGIEKASKLSGLSPRQLRYRADNGTIRVRKEGRNYLFLTDDLMQFRPNDLA